MLCVSLQHDLVVEALLKLDKSRKCFRLVRPAAGFLGSQPSCGAARHTFTANTHDIKQ
jgi:hypothetical protein